MGHVFSLVYILFDTVVKPDTLMFSVATYISPFIRFVVIYYKQVRNDCNLLQACFLFVKVVNVVFVTARCR